MTTSSLRLLALPFLALAMAACSSSGDSGDVLSASATSIDLSVQSIRDGAGNPIYPVALIGRYGQGCKRNPGGNWVVRLNANDGGIEVSRNDTFASCPLTVTGIEVQAGNSMLAETLVPPIVLRRGFAANPAQVTPANDPSTVLFYANLSILGLNGDAYTNTFAVSLLFSDDANACSLTAPPALYATVKGVAIGSKVPAPSYTLSFDQLRLMVDRNKIVLAESSGMFSLRVATSGGLTQTGEEWRIFDAGGDCCQTYTFDRIDDLFHTTPISRAIIEGYGAEVIDWRLLGLQGHALPTYRTIIVRHSDPSGVPSYELFQILFPGPINN